MMPISSSSMLSVVLLREEKRCSFKSHVLYDLIRQEHLINIIGKISSSSASVKRLSRIVIAICHGIPLVVHSIDTKFSRVNSSIVSERPRGWLTILPLSASETFLHCAFSNARPSRDLETLRTLWKGTNSEAASDWKKHFPACEVTTAGSNPGRRMWLVEIWKSENFDWFNMWSTLERR